MSVIEGAAKPPVAALVFGESIALDAAQQQKVANLAVLAAIRYDRQDDR
jgi:hypothetical protein